MWLTVNFDKAGYGEKSCCQSCYKIIENAQLSFLGKAPAYMVVLNDSTKVDI